MAVKIRKEVVDDALMRENKTQSWLADQIPTTPSHMNNMLAGRVSTSATTRDKIMSALKIPSDRWDELFYKVDEVSETSQPVPV